MKAIDRILGETAKRFRPPISTECVDPEFAFYYALTIVQARWPQGEKVIIQDPYFAYRYAKNILGHRWPEAEEAIANSHYKGSYLDAFPEAKEDWASNGWIGWLDT